MILLYHIQKQKSPILVFISGQNYLKGRILIPIISICAYKWMPHGCCDACQYA